MREIPCACGIRGTTQGSYLNSDHGTRGTQLWNSLPGITAEGGLGCPWVKDVGGYSNELGWTGVVFVASSAPAVWRTFLCLLQNVQLERRRSLGGCAVLGGWGVLAKASGIVGGGLLDDGRNMLQHINPIMTTRAGGRSQLDITDEW